jgi:hypothetical protein
MGAFTWRLGDPDLGRRYLAQAQRQRFDPIVPVKFESYDAKVQAKLTTLQSLNMLPDDWKRR